MLINLAQLEYISSAGLRVLILASKAEKEKQNGFGMCCIQENVNDVLAVTGFLTLFRVFETEEQAVAELTK